MVFLKKNKTERILVVVLEARNPGGKKLYGTLRSFDQFGKQNTKKKKKKKTRKNSKKKKISICL